MADLQPTAGLGEAALVVAVLTEHLPLKTLLLLREVSRHLCGVVTGNLPRSVTYQAYCDTDRIQVGLEPGCSLLAGTSCPVDSSLTVNKSSTSSLHRIGAHVMHIQALRRLVGPHLRQMTCCLSYVPFLHLLPSLEQLTVLECETEEWNSSILDLGALVAVPTLRKLTLDG